MFQLILNVFICCFKFVWLFSFCGTQKESIGHHLHWIVFYWDTIKQMWLGLLLCLISPFCFKEERNTPWVNGDRIFLFLGEIYFVDKNNLIHLVLNYFKNILNEKKSKFSKDALILSKIKAFIMLQNISSTTVFNIDNNKKCFLSSKSAY